MIQKTGGGYGFNSQVFNPAGNLIIRIGHGRILNPMNKLVKPVKPETEMWY